MSLLGARYYQVAGKAREWLGVQSDDEEAVAVGRGDQLVGRIAEHCHLSIQEADLLAVECRLLVTERSQSA
jgi:uncharacterized protein YjbJ (UPF0337 family)